MAEIPDLVRLLEYPRDEDALDRAFGEPDPFESDKNLLPHPDDRLRRSECCEKGHPKHSHASERISWQGVDFGNASTQELQS